MDRKDVINKVFPHSLFGYDPIAVDAFLDEVIREFDRLNNSIDVLQFRLAHELGDAYHQNDVLSRELEFARFDKRVEELVSASAASLLPEARIEPDEALQAPAANEPAPSEPALNAYAQAPAFNRRSYDPDEVTTEDRTPYENDEVRTEDRTPYDPDEVTTEDRTPYYG